VRITQAHISSSVASFSEQFYSKYSLMPYHAANQPTVIFGMYNAEDCQIYQNHKTPLVVVWCGTDGLRLNKNMAAILLKRTDTIHYAMGKFLSDDLKKFGIPHTIKPINPTHINLNATPRGHKVYSYGVKDWGFYNLYSVQRVSDNLHLEYTLASFETFSREQLLKVYADSFIGLRLTKHDGLPNTVIELGLMGRMCIYNGSLPNCIPWKNDYDIRENVLREYRNRHKPNDEISKAMKRYLNITDSWLEI
jgi:hypothetical protein